MRFPKRVEGYRSGLERTLAEQLEQAKVPYKYEGERIAYTDTRPHKYTPDFTLPNGIRIEGKGIFDADDRTKHLLIRQQHPSVDIRFVFSSSKRRLSKTSKTTYAAWCVKHGFLYADKCIPKEWLT